MEIPLFKTDLCPVVDEFEILALKKGAREAIHLQNKKVV